ncbi:MAG: hypothetical protein ABI347_05715 [Nitrososphaera sp.]
MFIGPRRAVLIGAIAAVALTIILIPLIFTVTAPNFDLVDVRLANVTIMSVEEGKIKLQPVFTIANPTDQTITTSKIEYELFADGVSLGTKVLSFEDVPLNGRPAIFSQGSVNIKQHLGDPFVVDESANADIFAKIRDNPASIKWKATGTASIDSTLIQNEKKFSSEI